MLVKTLVVGPFGTNCYVITDEGSLSCAVVDPGGDSNLILDYIESNKLKCEAVLLTHGHADHFLALNEVLAETGARLHMSSKDDNMPGGMGMPGLKAPVGTVFLKEGDEIAVGALKLRVMETPGHTLGGLSFVCEDSVFTGDTLFMGSCGRTDLPGGDMNVQLKSLKRLADLPGDYDVYPGHMDATRMSRERNTNPYVLMALKK